MESEPLFRAYREGDETVILRILNRRSDTACTLDEWSWLFPPEERGRLIVVGEKNDEIVSTCAGAPIRVRMHDREWAAIELHRVTLSDGDETDRVEDAFLEIFGSDDRLALVLATHAQGAQPPPGFVAGGQQRYSKLARERSSSAPLARIRYRAEPARDWEPRLDELWKRVRSSYPVAVVRDADHALRRYAAHPSTRHHRFLVSPRFSSRPVAFAVYAVEGGRLRWVDLVWDHDHPGALELLAFISGRLVGQLEANGEDLWLAGDDEAHSLLVKVGFSPDESSSAPVMAARSLVPELDAEDFVTSTYLTLADAGGLPR